MDNSLTLLGLLGVAPSYGYDLKHSYDRYFGLKKPLAFGQVYATLARMVRDGFLVETGTEAGGGPDRRRYEITPAGRERIAAWMFTPDVPSESLQSNLFAKTVVALLTDEDAGHLLDLQRAQHMQHMRALTRAKDGADIMHVLLYDHALFHIEADLRWIDLTSARLEAMKAQLK
ncbi:MAG: PadR family transcriptional regulator [Devosia sp.]|uniref:PadR family transcriptional regulator n=1 Tax=Devosia sp. 66-22 TaxID=1895753 RepID=UPI0009268BB5|nr:PadR family transcriptional regulator [Devosia sp. 66-22]MBN9347145.1 PadR family transcriptional regulator [Devosia sp.]OJX50440.1 MAG: PadR family transcriptional regulator [Devosia sp. 66-22]